MSVCVSFFYHSIANTNSIISGKRFYFVVVVLFIFPPTHSARFAFSKQLKKKLEAYWLFHSLSRLLQNENQTRPNTPQFPFALSRPEQCQFIDVQKRTTNGSNRNKYTTVLKRFQSKNHIFVCVCVCAIEIVYRKIYFMISDVCVCEIVIRPNRFRNKTDV